MSSVDVNQIEVKNEGGVVYSVKKYKYRGPYPANVWPPDEMVEAEIEIMDFGTSFGRNKITVIATESKDKLQPRINEALRNDKELNFDTEQDALQHMVNIVEKALLD